MSNTAKIRRQGGAAVFSIPPALLKMLGVDIGAELTLAVDNGKLVATPLKPKKKYSLEELLEGSDEMIELSREAAGWDSGAAVGNEIL
ncbi:MAG: PbsX family transcriptional regulator [Hoeflea sp.]|uniref:AbrB/MazE/SpoVT family DNA-binding domain-containing protein n=1 Tax=Hoeflea sp. TaxID=1940281 RepID=UPI001DFD7EEB|nr:AbrB/MazE/SpoVT family DNA-binding domain-containing protein [Hoeflea sp.]MBU4530466.1 PbsX family transcriptional regulator [Alphaproteobacteria bacterium]MBU4545253.1 PbsX family transcriptional regulator [Alphaproteobacteria bacterium]MBU4548902.1 PbsX family transcriptional regulator [Alphaproteobacteria bacterium]MBV1722056.1 PbsX family transcriptional regulator [Hoeflea sp.]MBV1761406.1 PbsX family transcriptional regulator [Hoeflea sp.]